MPSHFPFLPPRVRHWFAHSDPLTRREFYALFAILFGAHHLLALGVEAPQRQPCHRTQGG
jgi:hypothetical protein